MTDSVVRSDVHERYKAACRQVGNHLVGKIHELLRLYWQNSGLRAEVVVVLASTSVVAALSSAPRNAAETWMFDRRTGFLSAALHARVLVCEDTELAGWEYRLMLPTQEDMLGRATVARGTLDPEVSG